MQKGPIYATGVVTGILCGLCLVVIDIMFDGAKKTSLVFGRVLLGLLLGLIMPILFTLKDDKHPKNPVKM